MIKDNVPGISLYCSAIVSDFRISQTKVELKISSVWIDSREVGFGVDVSVTVLLLGR